MSGAQKGIKYAAICFAIFLVVAIISGIVSAGLSLFKISGFITDYKTSDIDTSNYNSFLDINLKYTNLTIAKGETLKVVNTNDKIKINQFDNKITITDKSNFFSRKKDYDLIVYVPENMKFDMVNVNSGAGKIKIDGIDANYVSFEFGAGKANLSNIKAQKADIETGAGKIDVTNSELNNLKLELGVGEATINSKITGQSKIECGIGKTTLNLEGTEEDYSFEIDKGIGTITLNNKELTDNTKIGNGLNYISIDGGIGRIIVNTKEGKDL